MRIDIIVKDARGRDVLWVVVKAGQLGDMLASKYVEFLRSAECPARYGMVVDTEKTRIVDFAAWPEHGLAATLDTTELLSRYEPEFSNLRIFHAYMTSLVDAWLTDLISRWKSSVPPGFEELNQIGLLDAIEGGETYREVVVEADPLR